MCHWAAAVVFEVPAVLVLPGKIHMTFPPMIWQLIVLLVGCVSSYDFNPVSLEEKEAAVEVFGDEQVYRAPFGKVYHTHKDRSSLDQSETLTVGTVKQTIAANPTRLCYSCAQQDNITDVVIEGAG